MVSTMLLHRERIRRILYPIIQGFHPVIGQLEVPGPTLPGRSELNKQSLIFRQPPVTVVIVNSRITPGTPALSG